MNSVFPPMPELHDLHDLLDPAKNPVTYAVPFFVLTILLELAALKWLDHDDEPQPTGYERRDTRASLSMGAGSLLFMTAFKCTIGDQTRCSRSPKSSMGPARLSHVCSRGCVNNRSRSARLSVTEARAPIGSAV